MRITVSAGEPSGALLGGLLAQAISRARPSVRIDWLEPSRAGILGFFEGARAAASLPKALAGAARSLRQTRPGLVVLVAYPGFNLPLGVHCRRLGIPVLYLAPPQAWAWGRARAHWLRRATDVAVCLFDFEVDVLKRAGVEAVYLGYPLLDHVAERLSDEASHLPDGTCCVAFFPGSRSAERRWHVPLFAQVLARLRRSYPGLRGLVSLPRGAVAIGGLEAVYDSRYALLRDASCAVLASGTVTLEAAIAGTPMVVSYHLSAVSRVAARLMVRTPHFALPNIIARRRVVPELLEPTPQGLTVEVLGLLGDAARAARMRSDLEKVCDRLGPRGGIERAAELALALART